MNLASGLGIARLKAINRVRRKTAHRRYASSESKRRSCWLETTLLLKLIGLISLHFLGPFQFLST